MSLNVGQLYVNIGANVSGLNSGLNQASQSLQNFGRKMTGIGTKLTATISLPLAMVGKNALNMAMDAVESEGFFTQSLKDMSDSARIWSEDLNKTYGLSAVQLRKNVSIMNMILDGMNIDKDISFTISTNLVELSHDMASVYGDFSQEELLKKIQSGMTGQTAGLAQLGINVRLEDLEATALKHGLIEVGDEITEQQKIALRYITIMDATNTMHGNMARELENPASKIRILKEQFRDISTEMGNILLPMMSKVIGFTQGLIDKWRSLSESKKQIITQFGILAVVIPPIITGIGLLALVIGALINPIGLVSVALLGLVGAFVYTETQNLSSTENIADAWEYALIKMEGTFGYFRDLNKIMWNEVALNALTAFSLIELGYNAISFWDDEKSWGMNDLYVETNQKQKETMDSLIGSVDKINNPRRNAMYRKVGSIGATYNTIPSAGERANGGVGEEIVSGNGGPLGMQRRQKELEDETIKNYENSMKEIFANFDNMGTGIGTGAGGKIDEEAQRVASAIDSITSSIINLQESMKSQIGIFDKFKWKTTSTWKLLRNAESRDKAYREREEMLSNLSGRGLSQDLMVQLQQADINQLGDLKGLDRMNDEQLKKWAGYTTNADRTAERMANVTVQNVNISIDGKEKNAKELAKEFYRELKLMGVDM